MTTEKTILHDDDVSVVPLLVAEARKNTPHWKRLVRREAKVLVALGFYVLPIKPLSKGYADVGFNANSATNDPEKVDAWFHPETGKFSGYNLGVACGTKKGNGVLVADADRHGQADGVAEWKELVNAHGKLGKHPWAKTPNDGEHHFFKSHPTFTRKSTKRRRESGLEVLSGVDGEFKAFVLVYPSVVQLGDGSLKQYEWQVHPQDCMPPDVPDWLPESFTVTEQRRQGKGRGSENVTEDDLEPVVPQDQIARMLEAIDPDRLSYEEWLSIGMAIHSQHQDGMQLWDEWSQRGVRYKPDECAKRWRGFRAVGPETSVTIGTLFYHTTNAGWKPAEGDTLCDEVSLAVAELNRTYAHIVIGGYERILRLLPDHGPTELHYDLLFPSAFQRLFPGQHLKKPNWKQRRKMPDIWLDSPYRRSYPRGIQLRPNEETPPNVFNTWSGFAYDAVEGDCSLFLAHTYDVLCSGNTEHFNWLLDWCADCVQDPGNLKGTAVVLRGQEGTGKGTFADTLGKLFGPHYVHLTNPKHLTGNFNAHLMEAILVFADEITYGGYVQTDGGLKGLVTERQLTGERKGINAIQYRNYAHLIIVSNGEWVIRAGENSRRWFVLEVDGSKANDRGYFDAIHDQLVNGGYEALLYELQNRKITSNLRFAPETEALAKQRRLSAAGRDKFFEFVEHSLEEGRWFEVMMVEHPDHGLCLDKRQVYSAYRDYAKDLGGSPLSDITFSKQWLKVFPYAKGKNTKEWPRSRGHGSGVMRLMVLRSRREMFNDFASFYGTTSIEADNIDEDWSREELGI